jgi:hypothetical protein
MGSQRLLVRAACVVPFLIFAVVYGTTAGHGFINDDFIWIHESRVGSVTDLVAFFHRESSFYRPIVSISFALNEWMFGLNPLGYGLTNVLLAFLCGGAIYALVIALRCSRGAAIFAAALWMLNFHGLRMAVLWTSGRTSLLVTLMATLTALALVRGWLWPALVFLVAALLSKEEAVLLPLVLFVWLLVLRRPSSGWLMLSAAVVLLYLVARAKTHAMTPWNAPQYYVPTFEAAHVFKNIKEYADRAGTTAILAMLGAVIVLGRARPFWDQHVRTLVVLGIVWVAGGFAPTILLPVRSDLYACLPSVGVCLIAAAVGERLWSGASEQKRTRLLAVAIIAVIAATPIYVARTGRWRRLEQFSATAMRDLAALTAAVPEHQTVVIDDDMTTGFNLSSAAGSLLSAAHLVVTGRDLRIWIEPPLSGILESGERAPCDTCVALRLKVAGGHVVPH